MSATVHDLLAARATRGQTPLHFDTDLDALAFVTAELEQLRRRTGESLLVTTDDVDTTLVRVMAVLRAIGDLYRDDERGSR